MHGTQLVSPFHFLPRVLTGQQLTAAPLLGLAAVAALLTSVGVARLRVRDLGQEAPEIRQNQPVEP
ncbi:hypothetical protein [Lentzea nigeriaca]|uniref:hypothetical protein n=1 Tax=Lentzea nigeriaca TaxID=1128665 RepID=UPI00195DA46B|nr:hypothetical protein [Lentzea nigeriaca]MBM7861576.1 putative exporter of polyketide antibiotics [Lentzea nigeriaca]